MSPSKVAVCAALKHDRIAIDAEVDLNQGDNGYFLRARLNVSMPGVARDVAEAIVDDDQSKDEG